MSELLRTEGLRKAFGDLTAVDAVDLHLEEGELSAIIGPNGAGKTTLINLLSGALAPDAGRIVFRGEDVTRLPGHLRVRRGLARSFQIMTIFPRLTVLENILLPVLTRQGQLLDAFAPFTRHTGAVAEAERILRDVALWEDGHRLAGVLSHGDQRRLELAIALATGPALCLLDEPSSGMHPAEQTVILDLIRALSGSRLATFVVVEHDMDVVFALATRIVVMNQGRILADGPPDAIRDNRAVRDIYLGEESR